MYLDCIFLVLSTYSFSSLLLYTEVLEINQELKEKEGSLVNLRASFSGILLLKSWLPLDIWGDDKDTNISGILFALGESIGGLIQTTTSLPNVETELTFVDYLPHSRHWFWSSTCYFSISEVSWMLKLRVGDWEGLSNLFKAAALRRQNQRYLKPFSLPQLGLYMARARCLVVIIRINGSFALYIIWYKTDINFNI